jgi:hypothetical protein
MTHTVPPSSGSLDRYICLLGADEVDELRTLACDL